MMLPCTLQNFDEVFPDEESCLDFLRYERWGDYYPVCPRCGCQDGYELKARGVTQCARPSCRHQFSVTAGTIMHKTKISIRKWFLAIAYYSEYPLLTLREYAALINVSYKTAWLMMRKINQAIVEWRSHRSEIAYNSEEVAAFPEAIREAFRGFVYYVRCCILSEPIYYRHRNCAFW